MVMTAEERLAKVLDLLTHLPIQSAASAEEPWMTVNLIDVTKIVAVASGDEDPADWEHEPCDASYGHSPHHWSEYRPAGGPLRIPHYCNGTPEEGSEWT